DVASANASHPRPDGTTFAPMWQRATRRPSSATALKRPRPRRATSSRNTRSIGSSAQKSRIWSGDGTITEGLGMRRETLGFCAMPIHLRAEPGDYAEGCLLPGDPLRAKYIAETFFDEARQVNGERGML